MAKSTLEKEAQKSILQYLTLKGYFHWRNNTGVMKTETSYFSFGAVGSPDIFVLHKGVFYGLEVKGKSKQSEVQKEFEIKMQKNGGVYRLCYSLDDVISLGL